MHRQKGFTLIELVVVIVILGLLAATALPRFVSLTREARVANLQGLAGALNSAAALARAQYIVNGSSAATTIQMEGQNVTVLDEAGNANLGGFPTADAAGILTAAQIDTAQDYTVSGGGSNPGDTLTIFPKSGGSTAQCNVTYTANGNPRVVIEPTCS